MSTAERQQNLTFSERLRIERDRLGVSQSELAEIGGVSRVTQGAYESGRRSPDAPYLMALAIFAGLDVQFVLTGVRSPNLHDVMEEPGEYSIKGTGALDRRETELVLKFRRLPGSEQKHLIAVVEAMLKRDGARPKE